MSGTICSHPVPFRIPSREQTTCLKRAFRLRCRPFSACSSDLGNDLRSRQRLAASQYAGILQCARFDEPCSAHVSVRRTSKLWHSTREVAREPSGSSGEPSPISVNFHDAHLVLATSNKGGFRHPRRLSLVPSSDLC